MTSLIIWIGVSNCWNSVYIASDSRISWSTPSLKVWDFGRKLFASRNYPEILGYCGDVLFPSQTLAQVIEHIDAGLLFSNEDTPQTKCDKIDAIIQKSFSKYPVLLSNTTFSIVYCTRQDLGKQPVVYIWILTFKAGNWDRKLLELPRKSDFVEALGSGKKTVKYFQKKWSSSEKNNKKTSRYVFSAFCDALKNEEDPLSGGSPQLVGIYRKDAAKNFGVIYNGERYLFGLPVHQDAIGEEIEWRNELFERCDGKNKIVQDGAQRHARPK